MKNQKSTLKNIDEEFANALQMAQYHSERAQFFTKEATRLNKEKAGVSTPAPVKGVLSQEVVDKFRAGFRKKLVFQQ